MDSNSHPNAKALCQTLKSTMKDVLPFDDPNKISDEDLLHRFLVARKCDLKLAEDLLRGYVAWRSTSRVNEIFNSSFPDVFSQKYPCGFHGTDKLGFPVYYERPDISGVDHLLQNFDRETLFRWHLYIMERGRQRYRHFERDRLTVVIDVGKIGASLVANPTAISFLKEMVKLDQERYPEHIRMMLIINAPWLFSGLYNMIKPMLDERVQKKIQIWKGSNFLSQIVEYIDMAQIPEEFGGQGGPWQRLSADPALYKLPKEERRKGGSLTTAGSAVCPTGRVTPQPHAKLEKDVELILGSTLLRTAQPHVPPATEDGIADNDAELTLGSPTSIESCDTFHTALDGVELSELDDQLRRLSFSFAQRPPPQISGCSMPETKNSNKVEERENRKSFKDSFASSSSSSSSSSRTSAAPEERLKEAPMMISPRVLTTTNSQPPHCRMRMIETTDGRGFPIWQANFCGRVIAETRNNLIIDPTISSNGFISDLPTACTTEGKPATTFAPPASTALVPPPPTKASSLLAELRVEDGHYIHTNVHIYDGNQMLRFILQKRRIHREIRIFIPSAKESATSPSQHSLFWHRSGPIKINKSSTDGFSNMAAKVNERSHFMSCKPLLKETGEHFLGNSGLSAGSSSLSLSSSSSGSRKSGIGWQVVWATKHQVPLMMCSPDMELAWDGPLKEESPAMIFALAVGLQALW